MFSASLKIRSTPPLNLKDTIYSLKAKPRTILLPITPNHTSVLDWLGSVRTYILITRLKAAEKVYRANMSDAMTADVSTEMQWSSGRKKEWKLVNLWKEMWWSIYTTSGVSWQSVSLNIKHPVTTLTLSL